LSIAEKQKPDVVVCLGDLFESDASSRWPSEAPWNFEEELLQADAFLKEIRKVSKCSTPVWCIGNHEDNAISPHRFSKKIRSLIDFRRHMDEVNNWKLIPYDYSPRGVFRLGQVTFLHGYEAGVNSDRDQGLMLGTPHGLTIMGHTHRPTEGICQARLSARKYLKSWHCNVGTLCDVRQMHYVQRTNTSLWGSACCIGVAEDLQSPRVSSRWKAKQLVYKMAWEDTPRKEMPSKSDTELFVTT
jgi:predicted phosphodiesterase